MNYQTTAILFHSLNYLFIYSRLHVCPPNNDVKKILIKDTRVTNKSKFTCFVYNCSMIVCSGLRSKAN